MDIAISAMICTEVYQEGARQKQRLQYTKDNQDGFQIVKTHVDLEAWAATVYTLLRYGEDSGRKKRVS